MRIATLTFIFLCIWTNIHVAKAETVQKECRSSEISNADKQWKIFSEAECNMAAGVFEGGSGQDTQNILCRIEKTKERLKYLKSHEPYKSFQHING